MAVNEQTLPELQPIFTLLNSHSNKLYQEGYFLKLDDQDIRGNPNSDRTWTECFAQLVGTVLSLWDAAELDAAGEDGEVLPKFINLTDASVKMLESLPTKTNDDQPLQNILSISTAGRNRYLLHFNSHHSLIQWTSGIRLAMYEHSTLQEAYTGALIAGKGKTLNNINVIMERARQPISEWVRVRFGAGVPWKRCYCVIEPPSEKEYQKAQKEHKKRSPYDRSQPVLKGEIRFFDTKKEAEKKKKHQKPIASITDAYSAYSIYPQAKELIDSSTLLKIEGNFTIHTEPVSSTEGFVFIMPETPPAVSGFEMLLRFLFPTWDTFALYGRPGRLVASALDTRSLMFAMPKNRRYGYLELLDVSGLIHADASETWSEREWRKRLKELTGQRMAAMEDGSSSVGHSRSASRNSKRLSYGNQNSSAPRARVGFADEGGSVRSSRSMSVTHPGARNDSAPPDPNRDRAFSAAAGNARHSRHISDTQLGDIPNFGPDSNSSLSSSQAPLRGTGPDRVRAFASDLASTPERVSSEDDSPIRGGPRVGNVSGMDHLGTPGPVHAPPAFAHGAGARPQQRPSPSPEMRRATNRLSSNTLSQLARASGLIPDSFSPEDPHELHFGGEGTAGSGSRNPDQRSPAVQTQTSANAVGMNANLNGSREVLTSPAAAYSTRDSPAPPLPPHVQDPAQKRSQSPLRGPPPPAGFSGNPPPPFHNGPPRGPPPPGNGRRTPPPSAMAQQQQQLSPSSGGGSPPVHRKPLPIRTTSLSRDHPDATSPASSQSSQRSFPSSGPRFRPVHENPPPVPGHARYPLNGQRAVIENDASSTNSPDYASTRRSSDTQESVDRPRAGVLKTVGDNNDESAKGPSEYDIPDINFGPTLKYSAPVLPSDKAAQATSRRSPGPGQALSHNRQQSGDNVRRSVVWPGPSAVTTSSDNAASLQQSLQPRSAPLNYAHQRNPSSDTLSGYKNSHSRHSSADLLSSARPASGSETPKRPGSRAGLLHSRNSSADLLVSGRPPSQGTAAALSAGEASSYLSAREQEHVARITGTPLMGYGGGKGPSQQGGLVGAIDARERERAQMRQGVSGQAVAQAIDQRQREQNQAQRAAQAAYAQSQQQQPPFGPGQGRPQTPGANRGMMMGGGGPGGPGGPGGYGPQTPGGMGRMMDGLGGPGGPPPFHPGMPGAMNPRSMSPGPNMMSPPPMMPGAGPNQMRSPPPMMPGAGPPRSMSPGPNNMMSPPGRYGPGGPQQRPPMGPGGGGGPYGPGSPGPGWNNNMPPPRQGPGPGPGPMSPPNPNFGGGRPQSPGFPPPQGQYARPGTPGTPGGMMRPGTPGTPGGMMRPGTPGQMRGPPPQQYHGQAF
ncbi:uncharacterized protein C8A04DRAFT_11319 [Dichotomopilus funicola]|uniref:PH domain-containing protein n=1 Tax=Dichotomopilus funicola TaxID=1934379 RepID=A0AAN6V4K8_9PEZI|nr:hypothetical protein C8A04DRAFT_11319 [Dichotomopilus funicola]